MKREQVGQNPQSSSRPAPAGKVHLVGAGPGDPDLLTVRAARLLAGCDVLVYDNLVSDAVLATVNPKARRIYVGKEAGNHALPQDQINSLLVNLAREGFEVVRLKGGDPYIFGRGGEEAEELVQAGIQCDVVPGITAASGISACTGMPLTHRDHARAVVFATGHLKDGSVDLDWPALARPHQTVVIYMGIGALQIICDQLIAHGLSADTPAAVIRKGTTREQVTLVSTLGDLPGAVKAARIKSPALIMVGSVVTLNARLAPQREAVKAAPTTSETCTV
ncbi:MAG TPA: uroporphyrinogen-III C-methyltransferase [Azoarcus taiwanensis]|uniref:uroporphyrinogen-III C-methyltransferase n=1 Tax=Azoarcus taiwanensis TaxID=666964 RepID=A0A972FFW7_9RHOO|nr:uroporphyrinogen-III C-methyltransferase [Azoarcus taiwanensis]NMG03960.1 uroporphyrinogen-III C-methyltransferase [Azoarcus taiwanensis]HRQ57035.1 uroporphyrinogen-III C-methyltransferase [Azoarcus taiwanensis]